MGNRCFVNVEIDINIHVNVDIHGIGVMAACQESVTGDFHGVSVLGWRAKVDDEVKMDGKRKIEVKKTQVIVEKERFK